MCRGELPTGVYLIVSLIGASFAMADDTSVEAGRKIAVDGVSIEKPACAACHLSNGAGQPDTGIPRLAGLTAGYIEAQLQYFASSARPSAVMETYAAALTGSQRRYAADYFASLPTPPSLDLLSATDAKLERGREIFLNGDFQTGALACAQCHGPTGLGVGDFSPRIAGQSAAYISWQLQNWRTNGIRDPQGAFMQAEAKRLSSSDTDAVAAYVATLGTDKASSP
jgi:cytochrome c553